MDSIFQGLINSFRVMAWFFAFAIWVGDGEMASATVFPFGPTFHDQPISCDVYLKQKRKSEALDSFFQAKVQTIGSPLTSKYRSMRRIMVQVDEVLEGHVPAKQFSVEYHEDSGHSGLPYQHEQEKFYYIMGGVSHNKDVYLPRLMERFPHPGTRKNVVLQWLTEWFSDCKSVW